MSGSRKPISAKEFAAMRDALATQLFGRPAEPVQPPRVRRSGRPLPARLDNHVKVNKAIAEFYAVNRGFRVQMAQLVAEIRDMMPLVAPEERARLLNFLVPYEKLAANPFDDRPTGKADVDIEHLASVISSQNAEFINSLAALRDAVANMQTFKTDLARLRADKAIMARLAERARTPLTLNHMVDRPLQALIQIESLLVAIKKELQQARYAATDATLEVVLDSLQDLQPYIKNVNDNSETFSFLDRIARLVHDLSGLEAQRVEQAGSMFDDAREKHNLLIKIESDIKEGKTQIAAGSADIPRILQNLLTVLLELQSKYESTPFSYTGYAIDSLYSAASYPFKLFGSKASTPTTQNKNSPTDELNEIVNDLRYRSRLAGVLHNRS